MTDGLIIKVVDGITCPRCGATEIDPATADLPFYDHTQPEAPHKVFQIRAFKVDAGDGHGWYSECLLCKRKYGNGWFAEDGHLEVETAQ